MPTEKFINLSTRKQRMILEAMRDEFLMRPYAQITVSRLIRRAGISRASFYTYFDGKDDMFSTMLKTLAGDMEGLLEEAFHRCGGLFCDSMEYVFYLLVENDVGRMYSRVYKHIADDEGCRSAFARVKQAYYREERWRDRGKACFKALDRPRYPGLDEDGLSCAVDMGMAIIDKAVLLWFDRCSEPEKLGEAVRAQLRILEQGIRRKEED